MLDWEWYSEPNTFRTFIHMILKANHTAGRWRGQEVKRGQLICSINHLSHELALTPRRIRTAITHLEETGEITVRTTNKFSIITICRYETYQSKDEAIDTQIVKQTALQSTSIRHAGDIQPTTNKNDKNERTEKKSYMSGKPDAVALLDYLNQKAGKSFRPVDAHIEMLKARLREPQVTAEGIKQMIDAKCRDWLNDEKMRHYLRPQTLFNKSKFADYYDQRNQTPKTGGTSEEDHAKGF